MAKNSEPGYLTRRALAGAVSLLGAAAARGDPAPASGLRVVVTGGHPGDPEYGCGGTVARMTARGDSATLLYLNRGQKSCPERPGDIGSTTRTAEAGKACSILKAQPAFAGQCDGHAVVDNEHYKQFGALLGKLNPQVVFTQWPIDGHRDHRATYALTFDAWLKSRKAFALFFYEVSDGEDTLMFSPSRYVDITPTVSAKRAACYAHASQTPDRYYALQSEVARFRGIESGHEMAEAFVEGRGGPSVQLP